MNKTLVHLAPSGVYSRAMVRIANALTHYAPSHVTITKRPDDAHLRVLYVIAPDAIPFARDIVARGQKIAVLQCCRYLTEAVDWSELWQAADLVWSYYDLSAHAAHYDFAFMYAPLGVDPTFVHMGQTVRSIRRNRVVTTGYVSSPHAEAIEEVWEAANRAGVEAVHIGPSSVEGMSKYPHNWRAVHEITDEELAQLYLTSTWVAALRHTEGFELPAVEGLVCGARPLLFERPCYRSWYGVHGTYVLDRGGHELVDDLVSVFRHVPRYIDDAERLKIASEFSWEKIATEFWERVG